MPILPNAPHKKFAQALAKGMNATETHALQGTAEDCAMAEGLRKRTGRTPRSGV